MNKKITKILSYNAIFTPNEQKGFNVSFPDFPGCVTFGKSFEDAKKYAKEALELWIEELNQFFSFNNKTIRNPPIRIFKN